MAASRCRRSLFAVVSSAAVLVPAAMAAAAACPVRPLPPCSPAAFTGSVRAHSSQCTPRSTPVCRVTRGSTGDANLRGVTGKTGKTGARGRTGVTGARGIRGLIGLRGQQGLDGLRGVDGQRGLQGVQGDVGAAGSTGPQGAAGVDGARGSTGAEGTTGSTGASGPQGLAGVQGTTGASGSTGSTGASGSIGSTGAAGSLGSTGADGSTGSTGADGSIGTTGPSGLVGATGDVGVAGTTGSTGQTGPTGAAPPGEYAYIYNLTAQTIAIDADIPFDSNGVIEGGITHAPGSTQIGFANAGDYKVSFSVSGTESNQMALFLNDTPVAGTTYGAGAGTDQNTGQAIFTVASGDSLTVNNHTSAAAVGLASAIGGTQANVNASVVIERVGP